jgi:hypothetical protein
MKYLVRQMGGNGVENGSDAPQQEHRRYCKCVHNVTQLVIILTLVDHYDLLDPDAPLISFWSCGWLGKPAGRWLTLLPD